MSTFKLSLAVSLVAAALLVSCGRDTGPVAPTQSRGAIADAVSECLAAQADCLKSIPASAPGTGPQVPAFFKCKRPYLFPCASTRIVVPHNPVPPNYRTPLRP